MHMSSPETEFFRFERTSKIIICARRSDYIFLLGIRNDETLWGNR
jgi:hypothetical protein